MGITIEITDAARDWLAEDGFDRVYGARPLRRAVQRHLENPMAKRIIGGEFKSGDTVLVDRGEDGLAFTLSSRPEGATPGESESEDGTEAEHVSEPTAATG